MATTHGRPIRGINLAEDAANCRNLVPGTVNLRADATDIAIEPASAACHVRYSVHGGRFQRMAAMETAMDGRIMVTDLWRSFLQLGIADVRCVTRKDRISHYFNDLASGGRISCLDNTADAKPSWHGLYRSYMRRKRNEDPSNATPLPFRIATPVVPGEHRIKDP